MKIHKEGYNILVIFFAFLVVLNLIVFAFLTSAAYIVLVISLILICFCIRFFRIPRRNFKLDSSAIYSPADGTVVAIEEVDDPDFLKCRCIQVSVFMSVWNVHINWFPVSGVVETYKYHPGDYLVASHPKSSTQNERTSVVVACPNGKKVLIRQIAGAVARRIVCYAKPTLQVEQCAELGFIKFGSRVDLFLPVGTAINVEIGQKVVGSITKLATW